MKDPGLTVLRRDTFLMQLDQVKLLTVASLPQLATAGDLVLIFLVLRKSTLTASSALRSRYTYKHTHLCSSDPNQSCQMLWPAHNVSLKCI